MHPVKCVVNSINPEFIFLDYENIVDQNVAQPWEEENGLYAVAVSFCPHPLKYIFHDHMS